MGSATRIAPTILVRGYIPSHRQHSGNLSRPRQNISSLRNDDICQDSCSPGYSGWFAGAHHLTVEILLLKANPRL